ncbi:MAG: class I SAM-dependent methyltransferase [Saprospiraceae bacterium]|nr:class I SAM-dependent methyltransferase [Saprospiraceae bacterium]
MSRNFISNVSIQYEYFDIQLDHPDWTGKKVLDFGGNNGNILSDPNCNISEGNYHCIDVSKEAILIGQNKYPKATFKFYDCFNPSFNPIGILDLPIPDLGVRYDYIFAYSIFTHILKDETIKKVNQLIHYLAPGGTLIFTFLKADYNGGKEYHGYEDITNLEKRIRKLNNGFLDQELFLNGQGNSYMALFDGKDLYTQDNYHLCPEESNVDTLFTYYSPEFLKSQFECVIKNPPSAPYDEFYPAELQHSCIIKNKGK